MSNEPREERQSIEGIPIPVYFDRYVTSEFRRLEGQIVDFKENVNQRFTSLQKEMNLRFEAVGLCFEAVDQQFEDLKKSTDSHFIDLDRRWEIRFNDFQKSTDLRFAEIDKRIERLEGYIKWILTLFAPVSIGILTIIVKLFLGTVTRGTVDYYRPSLFTPLTPI